MQTCLRQIRLPRQDFWKFCASIRRLATTGPERAAARFNKPGEAAQGREEGAIMRFAADGPDIPDDLLIARDEGRVVFFCGAGVSRARARLPSFFELAQS